MSGLPSSPFGAGRAVDAGAVLRAILRHRWGAGIVGAVALAAAGTLAIGLPDVYEAKAVLLVERQQVPSDYVRSTVTAEFDRRLHTITQSILGRSALTGLIQKFGLYPDLRAKLPMESVVERLRRNIGVELIRGTQRSAGAVATAFSITYRGDDPRTVAAVTNDLASMYMDEDLKMRERHAAGTTSFLGRQLDQELKRKLEEQEKVVREFKERHLGELPQQETANLSALDRLNGQLLLNGERQAQLRVERDALQKAVSAAGDLPGSATPEMLRARLETRRAELGQLRKRFTDKYPDVVQLKAEIEELERQLAELGPLPAAETGSAGYPAGPSFDAVTALRRVDAELAGLKTEEQTLRASMARYQQRVENAPKREQEFQSLNRDYETMQEIYNSLLKRYEEARLAESLEHHQKGEQFRLLDPAVVPEDPTAPNRPAFALFGLVLALAAAGGVILLREWADSSFHSADELRMAIAVPVLTSIQRIVTRRDRLRARAFWVFRATAAATLIGITVVGCYVLARDNTWLVLLTS
jgi:polysaccharide chain length determinant protein (PEP-CTERM system associated)